MCHEPKWGYKISTSSSTGRSAISSKKLSVCTTMCRRPATGSGVVGFWTCLCSEEADGGKKVESVYVMWTDTPAQGSVPSRGYLLYTVLLRSQNNQRE